MSSYTNFTTVTFYRNPLPGGNFISSSAPAENREYSRDDVAENVGVALKIGPKRAYKLLKIILLIESERFSVSSFAKEQEVTLRTIERDIEFLRKHQLILVEGSLKARKYKKLKKKLK